MFRSSLLACFVLAMASLGLVSYVTKHGRPSPLPAVALPVQKPNPAVPATMAEAVAAPAQSLGVETILKADRLGHFFADVDIDGHKIRMLVDTGASVLSLTSGDAASLGLHPSSADFRVPVATANGVGHVALTHLWRVSIGSVVIHDVDAFICPPGAMQQSLLGMSALSKLRNFEFSAGRLVLEQ
jgi:aspartyl protease family protein